MSDLTREQENRLAELAEQYAALEVVTPRKLTSTGPRYPWPASAYGHAAR